MAAQDQQQSAPPTFAELTKGDSGCDSIPIVLSLLEEDMREMQLNIGQC